MDLDKGIALARRWWGAIRRFIKWQFEPVVFVGNKERARKRNEKDSDAEHLAMVNRAWREMLREDAGRSRMLWWVRVFQSFVVFFGFLFFSFSLLSVAQTMALCAAGVTAVWGLVWLGGWNKKIENRIWEEVFEKRFGKGLYHRY